MPYYLHHTLAFQSKQVENIVIELYRKDVIPDTVIDLKCTSFEIQYMGGDGDKSDSILACEAVIGLWLPRNSPVDYQDFIITFHDEWKVIAYSDSQIVFTGFLLPGEGRASFKDLPYDMKLSATDGLGLLKQEPLSKFELAEFQSTHTILSFIQKVLAKTNLDLPIVVNCNIYESTMIDRTLDSSKDMFSQAKLHYRSFLKDPTTFMSCWDVLDIIFKQMFTFYQWNGKWVINRFAEMQDSVGPINWRTEYRDVAGIITPIGIKEINGPASIGRNRKLHPINANAEIYLAYPTKSAKHTFPYEVWDELPANNKFERGNIIFPLSGPGYTAFDIEEWDYYSVIDSTLSPTLDRAHRKSTYDAYGIEIIREVILPTSSLSTSDYRWLRSEPFGVNKGDILELNFDFKTTLSGSGTPAMVIYIETDTGDRYALDYHDTYSLGQWVGPAPSFLTTLSPVWAENFLTFEYISINFRTLPIPVDGTLYVVFINARPGSTNYFSKFSLQYIPFTAGGFLEVLGDYWYTEQNLPYKDNIDKEVGISDSVKKVFKGAMYREDGVTMTTPTWRRANRYEQRHYKEILNLGVYNHFYKRNRKITGTFAGTKFNPDSDPTIFEPISFHRHFQFPDATELNNILFMAVPPLRIDYKEGEINATFVECLNAANYTETLPTRADVIQDIIFLVAKTTNAQWNSAGGAPPTGTLGYPPVAFTGFLGSDTLNFWVPLTATPNFYADANGAGNSPTFTVTSQSSGTIKWFVTDIGTDIAVGNRFIIDIFGMQLVYTVEAKRLYDDGSQLGDTHRFGYNFK